jgi:hypothetical protein
MIAALYVERNGVYFRQPDVDPWDEERDARLYDGPYPVVAHPPCNTWCQLAPVNQKRWGKMIGDDDGCFAAALASVRKWGGVLEHPAYTLAWRAHDLPRPARGMWMKDFWDDGWVTEISQSAYGHPARKRTWLYYVGETPPPDLKWVDTRGEGVIGAVIHSGECVGRPKILGYESSRTPDLFIDVLLDLARNSNLVPA